MIYICVFVSIELLVMDYGFNLKFELPTYLSYNIYV